MAVTPVRFSNSHWIAAVARSPPPTIANGFTGPGMRPQIPISESGQTTIKTNTKPAGPVRTQDITSRDITPRKASACPRVRIAPASSRPIGSPRRRIRIGSGRAKTASVDQCRSRSRPKARTILRQRPGNPGPFPRHWLRTISSRTVFAFPLESRLPGKGHRIGVRVDPPVTVTPAACGPVGPKPESGRRPMLRVAPPSSHRPPWAGYSPT